MNIERQSALRTWIVAFLATLPLASSADGASFFFSGTSSDGHAVSAAVSFLLNDVADTVDVTLNNTTSLTLDSGELFTGLDFNIAGLTPTLVWDQGVQRTVDGSGAYVDTALPQDLSWSVASLGSGVYQLNFNPNAKDAILGPPTVGSYASANGSIKGNAGHNPFAAETASFRLSLPGLLPGAQVQLSSFRFGTTLAPATGTITSLPEPTSGAMAALGGAALVRRRRLVSL